MKNSLSGLPESVKQTISASLPLVIVIILFVLVGEFGVTKVLKLRSDINAAQTSETTLTQKLGLLQTLSASASEDATSANSALPSLDPSLIVISQLRSVASASGVVVSSIKTSSGQVSTSSLNEAVVSFSVSGSRPQVFKFTEDMTKIAPISVVDKISMSETSGNLKADLSVNSYWANYPKTIPAVDSPISDLTQSEKDTLSKISNLIQPAFTVISPSGGANLNPNPFGE